MNRKWIILILTLWLFESCVSFRDRLIKTGSQDEALQNAILDFSNSCRLYKKDKVFVVQVSKNEYDKFICILIGVNNMKLLLTEQAIVGSKGKLPSRYIEKEGKLFYWWDNDYPLTEEALAIFHKYHILQDNKDGAIVLPEFEIDESQKDAHYYFCKNNLTKYKRVTTNKGMGFYDIPNLDCY